MSVSAAPLLLIVASPTAVEIPPGPPPAAGEQAPANDDGEILVEGEYEAPQGDPLARINAQSYEVTQAVDVALVAPAAGVYREAVPGTARTGLRNFLRNLKAPIIALNFLLQLKPGKAAETVGRFGLNSTLGMGGVIDIARREPFNLPHRPNGFADTLGYYGVGPGPFFYLPLVGPTTLRDLAGGAVDASILPTAIGGPFAKLEYTIPASAIGALDYRIEFDELIASQQQADDPYNAAREYYLAQRQAQIDALKGLRPYPDAYAPATPVTSAPDEEESEPEIAE